MNKMAEHLTKYNISMFISVTCFGILALSIMHSSEMIPAEIRTEPNKMLNTILAIGWICGFLNGAFARISENRSKGIN
jgi:divalent metal cation (Fe/Co/Zn/Cd) transporter